ncbi:MAG: hypothetical protein AB8G22_16935 [Saprospiraceae bacterium]
MAKIIFKEKQRFSDRIILIALFIISLTSLLSALKHVSAPTANYANSIFLLVMFIVASVSLWWLTRLKLKVAISEDKINYKMSPVHSKKQSILWSKVKKCEIIRTSEAAQWSGGNITFNNEKRISLTGRNGLAITTKDGKHYFIGCKNIDGMQQALQKVNFG